MLRTLLIAALALAALLTGIYPEDASAGGWRRRPAWGGPDAVLLSGLGLLQLSLGLRHSEGALRLPGGLQLPAPLSGAAALGRRLARNLGVLNWAELVRDGRDALSGRRFSRILVLAR